MVTIIALSSCGITQSLAQGKYETELDNDVVAVYQLKAGPGESVPVFQSSRDTFWIALSEATVSFSRQQSKSEVHFQVGDARFFPSFDTKGLTNIGTSEFKAILVALKSRGLLSDGCECTGKTGKSVCGCKGAEHLDSLWALSFGEVTMAGTSLAVGEAFHYGSIRDDMLLVAVTDLNLQDMEKIDDDPSSLEMAAGDAVWIKGGKHRFKNLGDRTARFVTVEF